MATEISTYIHEGMELPFEDWSNTVHSFGDLASIIQTTHDAAQSSAVKAINRMQTMRNWLIGYYIIEFEQHGKDRAEYGTQLLKKLEEQVNRKGLTTTMFKWARKFYRLYPQMAENLPALISTTVSCKLSKQKCATVMHKLQSVEEEDYRQAYVSHYKENEMQPGDNPPVGILLCTRKGKKMVEYALAGMDNQLFVSTYMLQLPDKKTLEEFLLKQMGK